MEIQDSMPFYIFKASPNGELEYIDEEEKYRPAREKAHRLRATAPADDQTTYRIIFASTQAQGEMLLTSKQAHDDRIIGDD